MPLLLSWVKLIIPIFLSVAYIVIYVRYEVAFSSYKSMKFKFKEKDLEELYSSVSCRGINHTDRICKFKNLCYESLSQVFIFFHNYKSIMIGVPQDRFTPALIDFSSVYDHNTQYFNFIDLPASAFSKFNVNIIKGISLLFKRFNPENLMHVFHDDLIPAFVTLNENFLLNKNEGVQFVFADGRDPGPYSDLYEFFLDSRPLYLNNISSQLVCFEKVVIGLNKHSLWYQYGFRQPQGPIAKDLSSIFPVLLQFREYFKKRFSLPEETAKNKALLLTRGHNRKILNAGAVAKTIETRMNWKTCIVSLEKYNVIDVIKEIMSSRLITGMHGSLLILSLFLPSHSHIIELFPYGINPEICTPYRTLAEIPGLWLTYHSWENKIMSNTFPHPEYPPELGGILHLPEQKQESIKNSFVKPFLCCYNPEWLYRIYQDTVVDLESFSIILDNVLQEKQIINAKRNKFTDTDIITKRLYPSEVQNIACKVLSPNSLNISWEKPWNINFINTTTVEYELWYQTGENEDVKAFIMKKTFFSFIVDRSENIYIWIRCHIDGRIGPFNTDPFVCQKFA